MNPLALLPLAILAIPIIPVLIEIFKRRAKSQREIPEQTIYEYESKAYEEIPQEEEPEASDPVPPLEQMRAKARMKMSEDIIRVVGDVSIPSGLEIKNNIVAHGSLKLGSKCHIHGSIKAFGDVEVGQETIVEGHILSEGKVTVRRNAKVDGIVDATEDIILEENAVVEAVSAEKTVKLGLGAKINRKVSAGVSIVTTPPPILPLITEKPVLPEKEEVREVEEETERAGEVARPTVPSLEERREEKVMDEKDLLFKSLEDRIKSLESPKAERIDETMLEDLIPMEVKVYELAIRKCDVYEIGLRLLMDPVQVQRIINSLIEKRYLDRDLKPLTLEKPERSERAVEGRIGAARKVEEQRKEPEPRLGALPTNRVLGSLVTSKPGVEGETATEAKEAEYRAVTKIEMEESLKDWQKASALLFGRKETRREKPSRDADHPEVAKGEDRKLRETVEGTIVAAQPVEPQRKESKPELGALPTDRIFGSLVVSKPRVEESIRRAKEAENPSSKAENPGQMEEGKEMLSGTTEMNSKEKEAEGVDKKERKKFWGTLLSILVLSSVLFSQFAYYNSSLFAFLDQILPLNLRVWMIFLGSALILGLIGGLRFLNSQKPKMHLIVQKEKNS